MKVRIEQLAYNKEIEVVVIPDAMLSGDVLERREQVKKLSEEFGPFIRWPSQSAQLFQPHAFEDAVFTYRRRQ